EGVAQGVRAHAPGDPGQRGAPSHDRVKGADSQPPAAAVGEQRPRVTTATVQVRGQRARRPAAVRHDPLFAAFAEDAHRLLRAIDVVEVEPGELGDAQAGRVENL